MRNRLTHSCGATFPFRSTVRARILWAGGRMHELCPTGSRRVCYSVLQCACIAVPKGVTGGWPSPGWAAAEGREGAEGRSDREAGADERSDLSRVVREMHAERLCCRLEWHGPQGSQCRHCIDHRHCAALFVAECQPYALHGANASGGTRFGRTGCLT